MMVRVRFAVVVQLFVLLLTVCLLVRCTSAPRTPTEHTRDESVVGHTLDESAAEDSPVHYVEPIRCLRDISGSLMRDPINDIPAVAMSRVTMNYYHSLTHRLGWDRDDFNTEAYHHVGETGFREVLDEPLSTFSVDVDTASYSNVRRFLRQNRLPPKDAVRVEELINYFSYSYPAPAGAHPLAVKTEMSQCPWNRLHGLVHIGIKGKELERKQLPPSNLVFLVDVSGSMADRNKLPLLKRSLNLLVRELNAYDRVAIVTFCDAAALILPPTPGDEKKTIRDAIASMEADGMTTGEEGMRLAYEIAGNNYMKNGNNRVILATDGDFNVGPSSEGEMIEFVEEKRKEGVFLSILGFGTGNLKDSTLKAIADNGNGHYAYVDSLNEARKVLVRELGATLFTIASDVKVQVEFNPALVKAYRLVGYENRMLDNEDFEDDTKDAGEIGAGRTVTVLYELIPAGSQEGDPKVDGLKYQETQVKDDARTTDELMTVKIRYKPPNEETSREIVHPVADQHVPLGETSDDYRFSAAVAAFGMLLRDSEFKGEASYDGVLRLARQARGRDEEGYRAEFVQLVEQAAILDRRDGLHN